jgi:hypothetical protein
MGRPSALGPERTRLGDSPLACLACVSTAEQKPATGRRKIRPVVGCHAPWRARLPHSWCGPWRFGPSGPIRLKWDQAVSVDLLVRLTAACRSSMPNVSRRRRTWTYSRRPALIIRASIRRRRVANSGGRSYSAMSPQSIGATAAVRDCRIAEEKLPEGERKRQDKPVRRAEKRGHLTKMVHIRRPSRPLSAGQAEVDTAQGTNHLISRRNQTNLP